jgi:hypothetical protein
VRQYRYSENCDEIVIVLSDYKTEVGTAVSMKAVLANALNDIEELKARVPERPEPAEAPCEDRDAGELLSCKEQLACVNKQLLDYEGQITECRTTISRQRDAMECCWSVLENDGLVRTDGETLPQALAGYVKDHVDTRAALKSAEANLREYSRLTRGFREADSCCWDILREGGLVRRDLETLSRALSRFIGVKNEELASLRSKLQAVENALKALGT